MAYGYSNSIAPGGPPRLAVSPWPQGFTIPEIDPTTGLPVPTVITQAPLMRPTAPTALQPPSEAPGAPAAAPGGVPRFPRLAALGDRLRGAGERFAENRPNANKFLDDRRDTFSNIGMALLTGGPGRTGPQVLQGFHAGRESDRARIEQDEAEAAAAQRAEFFQGLLPTGGQGNARWTAEQGAMLAGMLEDPELAPMAMQIIMESAFKEPATGDPTDDMREYEAAVGQGFTGTLQDWLDRGASGGADRPTPYTDPARIAADVNAGYLTPEQGDQLLADLAAEDVVPETYGPIVTGPDAQAEGLDPEKAWQREADGQWHEVGGGGVDVHLPGQPQLGTIPAGYAAVQDENGQWRYVAVPGGPATQDQAGANLYASRMEVASPLIDQFATSGQNFWSRLAEGAGVVGNIVLGATDPGYQRFSQAARDFINATLRRESGATITPEEFRNAQIQYLPMPGDTPEVLEQKRQNRELAIAEIRAASGPFANPGQQEVPDPVATTPVAPPSVEALPAPVPPAVGAVEDGYRFIGGDPGNPNNWQRVP